MSGALLELLDLIARWVHVIAGIMWIGNSMLFNWLDRNLRPRSEPDSYGDIWLIHSGGFYLVEKNKGERVPGGVRLPNPLHWFKWQAYTTWLTGAALLIIVYYLGGRALLVDPGRAAVSAPTGVAIAVGTILGAFLLYEIVWRTIGRVKPIVAGGVSLAVLLGSVELLLRTLSGRAAFLHVGAMLGTIMAGNVAFTIMPSQRELVAALRAGRAPSQEIADRAKTRSIHNNYLTFPVIILMMAAHFPSLYAGRGDVTLLTLIAAGAAVRHVLNIRFTYRRWRPALATVLVAGTAMLAAELGAFGRRSAAPNATAPLPARADFADVHRVIDRRCAACHSSTPSDVSLGVMPAGVAFDTPEQIRALATRINERAVVQRTMPPGNKTRITDAERALLARWIADGASIK
ncbi:MAG TPA: urate hydroxylase PuuD [Gemmatimonadaceae bacterium]|nr:urate hydroxylase PuuD [Gemmatimonadaceae bacterium]